METQTTKTVENRTITCSECSTHQLEDSLEIDKFLEVWDFQSNKWVFLCQICNKNLDAEIIRNN